jgi:molybdopterin converting factor small subunit
MVTITVKLFAAYQDALGVPEVQLDFPPKRQCQRCAIASLTSTPTWLNGAI